MITGELPEKTETPEIVPLDDKKLSFMIDGDAILPDVQRSTGLFIPPSEHYQTIAGFVLDRLQRVPVKGDRISIDGWEIEVTSADLTSIDALVLTKVNSTEEENT